MARSTRRAFLGQLGAAAAVMPGLSSLPWEAGASSAVVTGQSSAVGATYDLVIAGGRVIDPAQDLSAVRDVAILHGRVARIDEHIPRAQARQVFDATDKIVTPGLIDVHSHVYEYGTPLGVNSDVVGNRSGVTTIVDAGTTGATMFPGFRKFVIEGARTRIYALLNISTAGCCTDEIYLDPRLINARAVLRVIEAHRDLIVGVKVRVRGRHEDLDHDISVMKTAREIADQAGVAIMMHWSTEPDLLAIMKAGDILTHPFNPRAGTRPTSLEARRPRPTRSSRRSWSSRIAASSPTASSPRHTISGRCPRRRRARAGFRMRSRPTLRDTRTGPRPACCCRCRSSSTSE